MTGLPDLNRLRLFAAVADAGGFTAAAERLGLAKAALSQQVARLEAELGVTLLTRTTRRVVLTEAGSQLLDACRGPLLQLDTALRELGAAASAPQGRLRITAPGDYAAGVLAPALAAFRERYPAVSFDLIASHDVLDLVQDRIDLAIRMGWLKDSTLRASRLSEFEQWVVAPPALAAAAGVDPQWLATQPWIALNLLPSPRLWTFVARDGLAQTVRMQGGCEVNSPVLVQALVRAGAGLSVLPDFMVHEAVARGELRRLYSDWSLPPAGIFAVYPSGQHVPAKVRAFIDFFRDWLATRAGEAKA
ncbi:LysR family transcriptional regulator [Chitinilyticum piscinae]|uniref:LysR family transcriptional regulator n=1 Tax=Chitinilyticum piscinae TaxID=2866724 RepID=A0A8J7KGW8_9NEIS|nr:LysR family transcriptional regulator [Chitinilyticum piscinae]MBE9610809.1 LysR family transcriptional regulator [Chitinilyticum piscinae]